eukprot:Seg7136.2 transcript_id=Seg7136.2/GoldUCD/mRNA.D3Y31 product="hypothetical protein" pseudo=true protein_id=Seg7136.2/GoldUCD/D3Y31
MFPSRYRCKWSHVDDFQKCIHCLGSFFLSLEMALAGSFVEPLLILPIREFQLSPTNPLASLLFFYQKHWA